jgi:glycosyltransferase involved in cell wall biosynthesis
MVALEALAYGAPVVLFDILALAWLPQSCVHRARRFDASEFGKAMARSVAQRKEEGFYRAVAQEYSWENVSAAYEKLIWKILHRQ